MNDQYHMQKARAPFIKVSFFVFPEYTCITLKLVCCYLKTMIATLSILWDNKRGCMCNVISKMGDVIEKKRNVKQCFTYFLIKNSFAGILVTGY